MVSLLPNSLLKPWSMYVSMIGTCLYTIFQFLFQIEQIKREASELITKIDSWYEDSKSSTEIYLQNLRSKRDELETLIKSNRKFLHETHVSEIILQKHERIESLQPAIERDSCLVGESVHNQTLSGWWISLKRMKLSIDSFTGVIGFWSFWNELPIWFIPIMYALGSTRFFPQLTQHLIPPTKTDKCSLLYWLKWKSCSIFANQRQYPPFFHKTCKSDENCCTLSSVHRSC